MDILIIINKGGLALTKKLLKKQKSQDITVVAGDSIISHLLAQSQITNQNVYNLISQEREKKLYLQAVEMIFNECDKNKKTPELVEFFDGFKIQFVSPLIETCFYNLFFNELLNNLNPKKIYLFEFPDAETQILKEIAIRNGWDLELCPINFIDRLKLFVLNFLPYIGREKKHYKKLISGLKLHWLKLLNSKIKVWRQNDSGLADILIGTFNCRNYSQIKEFSSLFNKLKDGGKSLLTLIDSGLSSKDYSPIINSDIPYCLVEAEEGTLKTQNSIEFDFFDNSPVLKKLALEFNWPQKYKTYKKFNREIAKILDKNKPKLVLGIGQFFWSTTALIKQARLKNIKTVLLSDTNNSLYQFDLSLIGNWAQKNNLLCPADDIIVLNDKIVNSCHNIFDKSYDNIKIHPAGSLKFSDWQKKIQSLNNLVKNHRDNFLRRWHLPDDTRIILFTTQQYAYSFDYTKILAQALLEISKSIKLANCYLVIKVHPLEFKWLYQLFGRYSKNKKIIITQDDDLYSLIVMAEFLVTYYSFTAIEALALGRRVLLLDFCHKNDRTALLNNQLVYQIDSIPALPEQLRILLEDKDKIDRQAVTPAPIAEFLNLKTNSLESYLEIIETALTKA